MVMLKAKAHYTLKLLILIIADGYAVVFFL